MFVEHLGVDSVGNRLRISLDPVPRTTDVRRKRPGHVFIGNHGVDLVGNQFGSGFPYRTLGYTPAPHHPPRPPTCRQLVKGEGWSDVCRTSQSGFSWESVWIRFPRTPNVRRKRGNGQIFVEHREVGSVRIQFRISLDPVSLHSAMSDKRGRPTVFKYLSNIAK